MWKSSISIAIIILLCWACEQEPPERLTKVEKYTVDTIFNKIKDSLYIEMDSICKSKYDSLYQNSVDSIKKVRLEEIQFMLEDEN